LLACLLAKIENDMPTASVAEKIAEWDKELDKGLDHCFNEHGRCDADCCPYAEGSEKESTLKNMFVTCKVHADRMRSFVKVDCCNHNVLRKLFGDGLPNGRSNDSEALHGRMGRVATKKVHFSTTVCACEPFNSMPVGVDSISFGLPHVRPMWALSTCGEPDEIKKNTHPKNITAQVREPRLEHDFQSQLPRRAAPGAARTSRGRGGEHAGRRRAAAAAGFRAAARGCGQTAPWRVWQLRRWCARQKQRAGACAQPRAQVHGPERSKRARKGQHVSA